MPLPSSEDNEFVLTAPVREDALPWLAPADKLALDAAPQWMTALRATSAEVFAQNGLPEPKTEGWQYTHLRALKPEQFAYNTVPPTVELPAPLIADSYRLVMLNGQFHPELSHLPAKAIVTKLADADAEAQTLLADVGGLANDPFRALNTAYLRDGVIVNVPANQTLDRPIEVVFVNKGSVATYPRMLYMIGENAEAVIIERFAGTGAYLQNATGTIEQKAASRLKFYRFLKDDLAATQMNHMTLRMGKNADFEGFSAAIGATLLRQDWRMQLLDSRISATLAGIYLIGGKQVHDITVSAGHFEPDCQSVQHFKGVIDDQARSVFQGKIHVHRPAQRTDGYQSHHALLLSDRAESNTKPELEIYADDVKCSHGATAGFLNPDSMFYMQSRGIPADAARALLIESFLAETLERVTHPAVKEALALEISDWLQAHRK